MEITPILEIKQFQENSKETDFYANMFSDHLKYHHGTISRPHKHDFYLAVLFTHGRGTHEIDFQSFPIQPGALFFLHPGQTHNWELSSDIEGYIFFHTREFYDGQFTLKSVLDFPMFHSTQYPPFLQLEDEDISRAIVFFKRLLNEYPLCSLNATEKVISLIDVFYLDMLDYMKLAKKHQVVNSSNYSSKTNQLEQLIEAHYRTSHLAKEYAQMLHVSPKHLNRMCDQTLGKTTTQLIHDRILLEAKRMLVHPKTRLTQVSEELGFKDYAYFSRWFKKKCELTPTQFKQQYT